MKGWSVLRVGCWMRYQLALACLISFDNLLCFSADNLWTDWSFHATHGVIWDGRKHFIFSSARGLLSMRLAQNTSAVTLVHGPFLRSRFAIFLLPFIHPEIDPKRFNIKMRSRKKRKKNICKQKKGSRENKQEILIFIRAKTVQLAKESSKAFSECESKEKNPFAPDFDSVGGGKSL